MRRSLSLLALFSLAAPSLAQEQPDERAERPIKYRDVTVLDIDDSTLIDAEATKPDGVMIVDPRPPAHLPMVRLRHSFAPEMRESVDQMK
jgi:hypothetical protein